MQLSGASAGRELRHLRFESIDWNGSRLKRSWVQIVIASKQGSMQEHNWRYNFATSRYHFWLFLKIQPSTAELVERG
jgi:hypothetical protein